MNYLRIHHDTKERSILLGPIRANFGLKLQVHLMKDFEHYSKHVSVYFSRLISL